MKLLVSACPLVENCKYNGGNNYSSSVAGFSIYAKALQTAGYKIIKAPDFERNPVLFELFTLIFS